jgi:hypothetical protein
MARHLFHIPLMPRSRAGRQIRSLYRAGKIFGGLPRPRSGSAQRFDREFARLGDIFARSFATPPAARFGEPILTR